MSSVGTKQIFLIILLALLTGAFYYYAYVYIVPVDRNLNAQIAAQQSEMGTMQQEMQDLQNGYNKFLDFKDQYDQLIKVGFFDAQDRLRAERFMQLAQEKSRVISAGYSIKPLKVIPNDKAKAVGYDLISTDIDVVVEALEDKDLFNFFFLLRNGLPGHVEVIDFDITKAADVTQPILRKIGSGDYEPLVKAVIKLRWKTLRQQANVEGEAQ